MDYIESVSKQLGELTTYDVKQYYNKAKNAVMNYTEMEAKVRDATNDDPWGTSSTAMQEIADATYGFQQFNEIMTTIYKRFTEKEAREWRQIYKALQLLEYLVKNGSERVVDDARSHVSIIKILRNFHYIDEKGKDQGINVRNRAKELAELLGDVDRIRQERRKSKASRQKYLGSGYGGGRYGGFGNEFGAGGSYSGAGFDEDRYGGTGGTSTGFAGTGIARHNDMARQQSEFATGHSYNGATREDDIDDYDAGEWDDRHDAGGPPTATSSRKPSTTPSATSSSSRVHSTSSHIPGGGASSSSASRDKPQPKKPEVNLFDFDDDDDVPVASLASASKPTPTVPAPASTNTNTSFPKPGASLDDDFDDFQGASGNANASSITQTQPQKPAQPTTSSNNNLFDLLNSTPGPSQQSQQPQTSANNNSFMNPAQTQPSIMSGNANNNKPAQTSVPQSSSKSAFDDLWDLAGGSSASSSSAKKNNTQQQSMSSLAQQKSSAGLWGATGSSSSNVGGGGSSSTGGSGSLI